MIFTLQQTEYIFFSFPVCCVDEMLVILVEYIYVSFQVYVHGSHVFKLIACVRLMFIDLKAHYFEPVRVFHKLGYQGSMVNIVTVTVLALNWLHCITFFHTFVVL